MQKTIIFIAIAVIVVLAVIGVLLFKEILKRASKLGKQQIAEATQNAKAIVAKAEEEAAARCDRAEKESQEMEQRTRQRESDKRRNFDRELRALKESQEADYARRKQIVEEKQTEIQNLELELNRDRSEIGRRTGELEALRESLEKQQEIIASKEHELEALIAENKRSLEQISGLSAAEAKQHLIDAMTQEAREEAQAYINEIVEETKMNASGEAKKIIIQSIQRVATETAIENAVTVFHIDNDDVKGRIIGREGRNIRALEAATEVEIIVDDTPEAIVLSAFDPVRREIARLALHQLVQDGRIHPARIEEVVDKVRKQVEEEIVETGKRTLIDLGIHGMHPELVRLIGKMKYRSSYGQNLLQHSRETANLCAVMASELGLNPKRAKRAGLLHDIGKVPDDEPELTHAILGMKL